LPRYAPFPLHRYTKQEQDGARELFPLCKLQEIKINDTDKKQETEYNQPPTEIRNEAL
jgi:hypothetical protein